MKTFSDPNTTIQQEQARIATFKRRVEILWQWAGEILSRDSATAITVEGDATDRFAEGDTLVIPLDSFETNHVITSISYSAMSDSTQITCSASTFAASGLPGLNIAKRLTVSGGNVERLIEMTPIEFENEGETLNEFLASEVSFGFDNGDGYFSNSTDTGIFDNTDIHWMRVYGGWRFATDRVLLFGGMVMRQFTKDDRYKKYFKITAFGHIKELERYPAWNISASTSSLVKISGVKVKDVIASDNFIESIRRIKFSFGDRDTLQGLLINALSIGVSEGFHVIKFSPPDLFQFDYGDWVQLTEGQSNADLTDGKGVAITVDAPKVFGLERDYVLIYVQRELNRPKLFQRGKSAVQLEDGKPRDLVADFEHIVYAESDFSTYTVITNIQDYETANVFEIFTSSAEEDHCLIFFSAVKFEGIQIDVDSDFSGVISFEYSQGLNAWGTLTVDDDTSALAQTGVISWQAPRDWIKSDYELGAPLDTLESLYAVRIVLGTHTSGSVTVKRAGKHLRLSAKDFSLAIEVDMQNLNASNAEASLIVLEDGGEYSAAQWLSNVSLQSIVESILERAGYKSGQFELDDLKFTLAFPVISLYGQPPVPFYRKKVTAICVDRNSDPNTVYLGLEDELWKVDDTASFTYLATLPGYSNASNGNYRVKIKRMVIDDNGYLQGLAWKEYNETLYGDDNDVSKRTAAIVFRSTDKLTITEASQIDESGDSIFFSGEVCWREGAEVAANRSQIGQEAATFGAGENISCPFDQIIMSVKTGDTGHDTRKAPKLTGESNPIAPIIYADLYRGAALAWHPAGWYFVHGVAAGTVDLKVRFTLGQNGFVFWDEENDVWVIQEWQSDTIKIVMLAYDGTITDHLTQADELTQLLSGCAGTGGIIYGSQMTWDDAGNTFPGNLSICELIEYDLGTSSSATTLFDCSSDTMEASQSLSGTHDGWDAIKSCSIIDMVYNPAEDSIHGCMLDRYDLTYHWFVFDIQAEKMYSSQSATGIDFNEGMQLTGFIYNDEDDHVYAVAVDRRYRENEAVLLKADYGSARAAGSEIIITRCDAVVSADVDLRAGLALGNDGRIYGVTGNFRNYLFQWDNVFFPRVFLADFGAKNMREVLTDCCQVLNRIVNFRANRTVRIVARDAYDGSKTLYDDKHIQTLQPIETWRHYYDRVNVSWRDPVSGENGTESFGAEGWENLELNIENPLIQNRQLAAAVAESYFDFFNTPRKLVTGRLVPMLELEEYDRVKFIVKKSRTDIPREVYYRLVRVSFDPDQLYVDFEALS